MVAAGVAREVLVQIAYAIGVAQPVSVFVNTFGTCNIPMNDSEIAAKISEIFDLRPAKIIERFQLKNPIYEVSASYGHMGRDPFTKMVEVVENGVPVQKEIQFFGCEKLDFVEKIKKSLTIT